MTIATQLSSLDNLTGNLQFTVTAAVPQTVLICQYDFSKKCFGCNNYGQMSLLSLNLLLKY